MKPCATCGRVNPAEATYCMTCGASLKDAPTTERRSWEGTSGKEGAASQKQDPKRSAFERVTPLVEDFAWDVVRAGTKLYFGLRDPQGADEASRRARDRVERFKDVVAEARVGHRRRGEPRPGGDRGRE